MMRFQKTMFSKIAFELGRSVKTSDLDQKASKFYELVPLKGINEALSAPEGSVVVWPLLEPTSYEKRK
jgi:hypothetical protein